MLNKNLRILIVRGHGGSDCGAVSGKLVEREMNTVTAYALYKKLKSVGFNVFYEENNVAVNGEQALANGYDLVISVHYNAGGGDGFEAYCNPANADTMAICRAIEVEVKAIGQNSRGIKSGIGYKMVSGIEPNAIILEGGFIDNANDRVLFDETHEQEALGIAYAKGIMKYFGVQEPKPTPPTTGKQKFYRVIVGSYKERANAVAQQDKLKAKGFDSFLVYEEI